jgi:endonuclease YncB( thermonuclease family)
MTTLRELVILVAFISWPVLSLAADFTAQVVGVLDGDTIEVLREDKTKERIRLYGIDCPEKQQPFSVRPKKPHHSSSSARRSESKHTAEIDMGVR